MLMCYKLNSIRVTFLQKEHATRHEKTYIIVYCDTNTKIMVPSTPAAFAIYIAREILCLTNLPALGSSVHVHSLQDLIELIQKDLSARASAILNFISDWLKNISINN